MARRALLAAAVAAGILAVLIAVSGGVQASAGGVRVSARSPLAAALTALALFAAWWWQASRRSSIGADLADMTVWLERRVRLVLAALALLSAVLVLAFGTYSPAGADASGYLSQAAMWASGATGVADPLVSLPGWPLSAWGSTPLGWRPATDAGWQVPTYAPGLPWLLALPHAAAGIAGAMAVIAATAAVAVWATGALALRLAGPLAALPAGAALALSPTFLFQSFQPMSDVPVTAAWALCWWMVAAGAPARAGAGAAVAVLIRPNLAPLAAIPWLVAAARAATGERRASAAAFALPVAVAGVLIAAVQWHWYGSPLRSGYGSAGELFAVANVLPNGRLYLAWLWEAEPALVTAAAAALVASAATAARRGPDGLPPTGAWPRGQVMAWAGLAAFAAGVILAYLLYAIFEVWSYVRFLLPALSVVAVGIGATLSRLLARCRCSWRAPGVVIFCLCLAAAGIRTARSLEVFSVAAASSRASEAGNALARVLPANAVLLAGEQSGSMRYLTGRPVVRWESLDATTLPRTIAALEAGGHEVWWVLDQWEESLVRGRFAGVPEAALDRPAEVEGGRLMRTRAWRAR